MADQNDRGIAEFFSDRVQIGGVVVDADAFGIDGQRAATVGAIIPMRDAHQAREIVPEVLVDEPVANDAVREQRRVGFARLSLFRLNIPERKMSVGEGQLTGVRRPHQLICDGSQCARQMGTAK